MLLLHKCLLEVNKVAVLSVCGGIQVIIIRISLLIENNEYVLCVPGNLFMYLFVCLGFGFAAGEPKFDVLYLFFIYF